jgi:hypothetical protein
MAILYADSLAAGLARSGEIRFEPESGLNELRNAWPNHEASHAIMTAEKTITDLLAAPLSPDWTVEGLAEQLLGTIAAQNAEGEHEFVLDADSTADRQARRLLRPLLACLAIKSAAEAGTTANLYGGQLSFKQQSPDGPVWVHGRFENRPGNVHIALRRSDSPPDQSTSLEEHAADLSEHRNQLLPQRSEVMANFRMERLFVILNEPVPGLDHVQAIDAVEFAWHNSDQHAESLGVTPFGAFTFAPFEQPEWSAPIEGLTTVRALQNLYAKWIENGTNPFGYAEEVIVQKAAVLKQVEDVLTAADSLGRQFYLQARDLE